MTEATLLERATRIVEKLKLAKERKLQSFGSESHGFKSNPPLSEGEIAAFEKEHNLTLPEGYRTYLKVVGNGGGGPYYGIYPLSEAKDLIEWITDDAPSDVLSRPWPARPQ